MKVERILSESDLIPQRAQNTTRKKVDGVFNEDAVSFEGKEQRNDGGEGAHLTYGRRPQKKVHEEETETPKDDLDVVA